MTIFSHSDFDHHEGVHVLSDASVGLKAIVAVHSTARGPSAGGTRFWTYAHDTDALTDALRLSKAMSYKNAMADLPLGGGKGVIMKPEGEIDRQVFFAAYGKLLNRLGGSYITAEDVGMTPADMDAIATQTSYVAGVSQGAAASGDPSPITADGVFRGLQVAWSHYAGTSDLSGVRIAVQGLGHVGYHLCRLLHGAGASLWVTDIREDVVQQANAEFGACAVALDSIHAQDVDMFAPCALGGAINAKTIGDIKAKVIGGAANNQLLTSDMGEALRQRGILYCPDYVINAGGIINIAAELSGTYDPTWVEGKLEGLKVTLAEVLSRADAENLPANIVADRMAQERINSA